MFKRQEEVDERRLWVYESRKEKKIMQIRWILYLTRTYTRIKIAKQSD